MKPYIVDTEWKDKIAIATPLVEKWISEGVDRTFILKTRDDKEMVLTTEELKQPLFESKKDFKNTLKIPGFPERYTLRYYNIK